jgi:hypothetical protein
VLELVRTTELNRSDDARQSLLPAPLSIVLTFIGCSEMGIIRGSLSKRWNYLQGNYLITRDEPALSIRFLLRDEPIPLLGYPERAPRIGCCILLHKDGAERCL